MAISSSAPLSVVPAQSSGNEGRCGSILPPTHLIEIIKVLSVIVWIECGSAEQMVAEIPTGPGVEAFTITND